MRNLQAEIKQANDKLSVLLKREQSIPVECDEWEYICYAIAHIQAWLSMAEIKTPRRTAKELLTTGRVALYEKKYASKI